MQRKTLRRMPFAAAIPLAVATVIVVIAAASTPARAQPDAPPRLTSPEIAANGDVVLRVRAPHADGVQLVSGGDIPGVPFGLGLPLTRGADGTWEVTLPALDSGAYRYQFNIDGVATLDPSNRSTSESNGNAWSLFYVPGADYMDIANLPHGAVADVHYHSSVLDRSRRMHVYTPPGYQRNRDRYPVFYLLHGAFDSDDSWSSVGRAGFILDNLIAAGQAVPMIVVMPDGHTGTFTPGRSNLPLDEFAREFAIDIRPFIESHYRVRTERASTALAGLSMGGAQTLEIAMRDLAAYGYLGVFSSGVFGIAESTEWPDRYRAALDDASLRRGLELVWFSTGSEDFLLDTTRRSVAMLQAHGFDVVFEESTGGHTWINWRQYLSKFAPQLFH